MTKDLKDVRIPSGLSERQIKIAQNYVTFNRDVGGSVQAFIETQRPFSSKTWYEWMDNFRFSQYVHDLRGSVVTEDERMAYQRIKKRIIEIASSPTASINEIKLFTEHFAEVVEFEKRESMLRAGIQPKGSDIDTRSLDERKQALFALRSKEGGESK